VFVGVFRCARVCVCVCVCVIFKDFTFTFQNSVERRLNLKHVKK